MKLFIFLATVAIAVYLAATQEDNKETRGLVPGASLRNRWFPISLPIPGGGSGTATTAASSGGLASGECPGGNVRGCPDTMCNTTAGFTTICNDDVRAHCYDQALAYPVGCPGSMATSPKCDRGCR